MIHLVLAAHSWPSRAKSADDDDDDVNVDDETYKERAGCSMANSIWFSLALLHEA